MRSPQPSPQSRIPQTHLIIKLLETQFQLTLKIHCYRASILNAIVRQLAFVHNPRQSTVATEYNRIVKTASFLQTTTTSILIHIRTDRIHKPPTHKSICRTRIILTLQEYPHLRTSKVFINHWAQTVTVHKLPAYRARRSWSGVVGDTTDNKVVNTTVGLTILGKHQ